MILQAEPKPRLGKTNFNLLHWYNKLNQYETYDMDD